MSALQATRATGEQTILEEKAAEEFKASLRGELLSASEDGYDTARKVWNGMIDKRPALIARCAGAADVIQCVRFAREHDLLVSVRGGGHNVAGNAVCDGGLMIDLSPMKSIRVDPVGRTARGYKRAGSASFSTSQGSTRREETDSASGFTRLPCASPW